MKKNIKKNGKLLLKKETVRTLSPTQLTQVGGGGEPHTTDPSHVRGCY